MKKLKFIFICLLSIQTYAQVEVSTITSNFNGSGGLSLDDQGNLYIGDFGDMLGGPDTDGIPNNVLKLDTDLNLTTYATNFVGASGNTFNNNGILFQSDIRDNAIYQIIDGVRTFVTSDGIISPVGIAFDSNDNFYVCNCGNGTIQKITPDGTSTIFASGEEFSCPNGVTIDEEGNLYVSNFSNKHIVKITPTGEKSILGETSDDNGHLDYDPISRNLYIASYKGNQIYSLNIDTETMSVLAGTGVRGNDDGPGDSATFSTPNGIAVSDDGLLIYVNCAVLLDGIIINPQIIRKIALSDLGLNKNNQPFYNAKVHPNPAHEIITIESEFPMNDPNIRLCIYSPDGRLVHETTKTTTIGVPLNQAVDISNLAAGSYLYNVSSQEEQLFHGKFIKK